jgi:hypothetical protein
MDKQKEKLSMDAVKLKLELIQKMNVDMEKTNSSDKKKSKPSTKNKKTDKSENKKAGGKSSDGLKKTVKETDSVSKNQIKEKSQKKKEKKEASEELDTETDTTTRKWEDKKGKIFLKGPFTPEEEKKIINAFMEYVFENNIDENDIIKLIIEKQGKKQISIWPKIAECLPDRSVQSIHNYCHRKFNPYNYKGNWTTEEIEKLLVLVKEHGPKWEIIGKELERTSTNVKDKYKQIGGRYHHSRQKEFNLILCLKLLKYIEEWLSTNDELEATYQLLKHPYKFRCDLEEKYNQVFTFNESNNKFLIDSSVKESNSKVIIKNILKKLVDSDVLYDIVDKNVEISWSFVSEKMKIYSASDCQNNWDKILREYGLEKRTKLNKDLKMIKQ